MRFISIFVLSIIATESILHFQLGAPSPTPEPIFLNYEYVEIYKRYFEKERLNNGEVLYKANRIKPSSQPQALPFSVNKEKDRKRIFVLGGSVALMFNWDSYLKDVLEESVHGMKFEIIGCGMGGYDSYRESIIQQEILNYEPDLIILMSGNNEFYTPIRLNPLAYKANRFLSKLWLYRISQKKLRDSNIITSFRRNQISKEERLANFEKNLEVMIRRAKRRNIPMAICTLPANFRDCPPGGSAPWHERDFLTAWYASENGNFEEAIKRFKRFLNIHPEGPLGHYFLAQCYDALKDYSQSQSHYLRALELDANPGNRCPPSRNETIRRLCMKWDAILVDLEMAFIRTSQNGLVGKELMQDNCHWRREYNPLICDEIVRALINYNQAHYSPIFELSKHYKTDKNYQSTTVTNSTEGAIKLLSSAMIQIGITDFVNEIAVASCEDVYQFAPNLFINKVLLKEEIFKEISTSWWIHEASTVVSEFEVRWPIFLFHVGEAHRRLRLYSRGIEYFDEVIRLNPNLWYPYLGLGILHSKMGLIDEARRDFQEADRRSGRHPLVSFYLENLGLRHIEI